MEVKRFGLFLVVYSPISPWYRVQVVAAFSQEFSPYPTRKLNPDVCIKVHTHICSHRQTHLETIYTDKERTCRCTNTCNLQLTTDSLISGLSHENTPYMVTSVLVRGLVCGCGPHCFLLDHKVSHLFICQCR